MRLSAAFTRRAASAVAVGAAAAAALVGVVAPAGARTPVLTNIGVSQTTAVNATQTSYPVLVHWTNSGGATYVRIDRQDTTTGTSTFVAEVNASSKQLNDVVTMGGTNNSAGDHYSYTLTALDAGGNVLGAYSSYTFYPRARDDNSSANMYFYSGAWYRKSLTGTTMGHYTYSSSYGASMEVYSCFYNIGLVGTTSPSGGTANVVINGVIVKSINFHSATTKKRVLLFKTGYPTPTCEWVYLQQTSGQINLDTVQTFDQG